MKKTISLILLFVFIFTINAFAGELSILDYGVGVEYPSRSIDGNNSTATVLNDSGGNIKYLVNGEPEDYIALTIYGDGGRLQIRVYDADNNKIFSGTQTISAKETIYIDVENPHKLELLPYPGVYKIYLYEVQMIKKELIPPGEVTNLQANTSMEQVSLSWTNPADSDLSKVIIYRDGVEVWQGLATSWTDTNITPGASYTYKIATVDTSGNQSAGVETNATIPEPDTTAPGEVTNLQANATMEQVSLSWTNPADSDLSKVIIYRDGVEVWQGLAATWTDTNITPGAKYLYKIATVDTSGNQSAGVETNTTIPEPPKAPPTPAKIKATAGNGYVLLEWTSKGEILSSSLFPTVYAAGETEYNVYRDGQMLATVNGTKYIDRTVENGTTYKYAVTTVVDGSESAPIEISAMPSVMGDMHTTVDMPITVWDLIQSTFNWIALFGGILLLAVAVHFAPEVVAFIKDTVKEA